MNEMRAMISDTAEKIFRDLCTKDVVDDAEGGTWPQEVWNALEESGLTLASVPEHLGGSGGNLGDAMAVLSQAGRYAAPLPLAETFLAGWILSELGSEVPTGPLTVAIPRAHDRVTYRTDGSILSGTIARAAWPAQSDRVVVVAGDTIAVVEPSQCAISPARNLAGEPRDELTFEDVHVLEHDALPMRGSVNLDTIRELGALTRSVLMAGAMERILALTVEHANVRIQFGRPIASFQAVRQQIAVMATQVAAARVAADNAVQAAEAGNPGTDIAAAKARVGEAAGIVAEIGHQIHGAMGITHEHSLHQYTRRLWSWRDEFGAEPEWQAVIGRTVAEQGADRLWDFIVGA